MNDGDLAVQLKAIMRKMPSAVALITTVDKDEDGFAGLAASAVIPVSMDPPSMLVAINRGASAFEALAQTGRFCINLLCNSQTELVTLFSNSSRRAERFAGSGWSYHLGLPFLTSACASIFCRIETTQIFGTHALFVARVEDATTGSGSDPMGWIEGGYARLVPLSATR